MALLLAIHALGQAAFLTESQVAPLPGLITNLTQIRELDLNAARQALPVRITATVTYFENQWPSLFVQDSGSAAYVHFGDPAPSVRPGDQVEIEGSTGEGFAPLIRGTTIRVRGRVTLPPPLPTTLEELVHGRLDCHRVIVRTTVRSMHRTWGRLYLNVGEASGRFEVHVAEYQHPLPRHLLHARVELTGIASVKLNERGNVIGARVSVASADDIRILTPAPEHPWDRPTQTIGTLGRLDPQGSTHLRTKVRGQVTLATASGRIFLEDDSGGVELRLPPQPAEVDVQGDYLEPSTPPEIHPGDHIEALGYVTPAPHAAVLNDTTLRRQSSGQLPPAPATTAEAVLRDHLHARRVRLEGRVLASDVTAGLHGAIHRLTLNSDGIILTAEHEGSKPLPVVVNSRVQVTGVADFGATQETRPSGFLLWIGQPDALLLLAGPPLVTPDRVLRFGLPVSALVVGWIVLLRRQVTVRTAALSTANTELRNEIEERKRSQRALAESERQTRQIVDQALDAIIITDETGRIQGWNPRAEVIFGWDAHEALGRSFADLILPPPAPPGSDTSMASLVAAQLSVERRELVSRRRDGTEFRIELAVAPLDLGGRRIYSCFAHDITDRHRAEEELRRNLARERELGEMKSAFVSLVSHEFRTPLGVILSAAEVLRRYFDRLPAAKRERHLDMIFRSTRNLASLIDGVLLLGRVEEGRVAFTPAPVHVESLCRQICDEVESLTQGTGVIRFEATTSLDGAVSDETLLRHILTNLLSNAVKYSEPGDPIRLTARRNHDRLVLTVTDRGIGIPPEDQSRLFQSFARARNVGQRPGTGLGLVIVRRCVDLHGGSLQLESSPGVGTTVRVDLPAFPPAPSPSTPAS